MSKESLSDQCLKTSSTIEGNRRVTHPSFRPICTRHIVYEDMAAQTVVTPGCSRISRSGSADCHCCDKHR